MNLFKSFRRNASTWKLHKVSPSLTIPDHIVKPPYARGIPIADSQHIEIRNAEEIAAMRRVGRFTSQIRALAGRHCKVGVTTDEVDQAVHAASVKHHFYPSPLGYRGFPKSCCTSVNQVVCHGIPDARPLEDGDIVNVDVSTFMDEFHGDCSETFLVGAVDDASRELVQATEAVVKLAISICKPGVPFNRIGAVIEDYCRERGFQVIPNWGGHGIGRDFHVPPSILHVHNLYPGVMLPGMVFTIEPILTRGDIDNYILDEDGWTVVTRDDQRASQHEETILITEEGAEILTSHTEELE